MAATIRSAVPLTALDARVRAWLKAQVRGQQVALGQALEKAGVVKSGQSWVSQYVNDGEAVATIDHLIVIASFFERSLPEMLTEAASDQSRHSADQRSGSHHHGGPDALPAASIERALVSELTELRQRVKKYEVALDSLSHVAKQLAEIAAVRNQGGAATATPARSSGRRRKVG